jgi:hypothetical protein
MVKAGNPIRGWWEEVNWKAGESRKTRRHKGLSFGGYSIVGGGGDSGGDKTPAAVEAWASSHAAPSVSASTWR